MGNGMKCQGCGTENPDGKKYCGECGIKLPELSAWVQSATLRRCQSCGKSTALDASFCPSCGRDFRADRMTSSATKTQEGPDRSLSSKLAVAVLLMLIGGTISLAGLAILYHGYFGDYAYQITPLENMMTVAWAISAAVGLAGAFFAAYRRYAGIAITGAIFCIIAGFPVYYVGMVPGLAALALLIPVRKEFQE